MLVSLTVGKVDAGVAVLLTEDNRLIEFPSVLLPDNITSGSIVDITVSPNRAAEKTSVDAFQSLQKRILDTYGISSPSPPVLRLRNATQTSLVLEWDPIDLATASLKSLSLYRNDSKAGSIPKPTEMLSTKISGLAIDTEYTFHLVLRTSAGTFSSSKLKCRTHKMTDLSGITVTPGILPENLKESLSAAVNRIGGKMLDTVRIDTTHFVCTEGRGPAWEKAVEMNIPVVRPEWVEGCEREGTIVSVRGYYLNADPKHRQIGVGVGAQQNRDNALLNAESNSRPSTQRKNAPPNINTPPEGQEVQRPVVTPFPGAETQNGAAHEEDEEDSASESPPPPPPKDAQGKQDTNQGKEQQDEDSETESEGGEAENTAPKPATKPTQKSEGTEKSAKAQDDKSPSRDRSLPQFRQESSKPNGTTGEEMDEVPL